MGGGGGAKCGRFFFFIFVYQNGIVCHFNVIVGQEQSKLCVVAQTDPLLSSFYFPINGLVPPPPPPPSNDIAASASTLFHTTTKKKRKTNSLQNYSFKINYGILYTPYISRGFYFREFCESGATREINNARKNIYLQSRRMNATCTQCTCKAHDTTSLILISPFIALFDRENVLKFRFAKIRLAKYMAYTVFVSPCAINS